MRVRPSVLWIVKRTVSSSLLAKRSLTAPARQHNTYHNPVTRCEGVLHICSHDVMQQTSGGLAELSESGPGNSTALRSPSKLCHLPIMALRVPPEGATNIGIAQYVLDHHHSVIHHHQPEIADIAAVKSARVSCRVFVHIYISSRGEPAYI